MQVDQSLFSAKTGSVRSRAGTRETAARTACVIACPNTATVARISASLPRRTACGSGQAPVRCEKCTSADTTTREGDYDISRYENIAPVPPRVDRRAASPGVLLRRLGRHPPPSRLGRRRGGAVIGPHLKAPASGITAIALPAKSAQHPLERLWGFWNSSRARPLAPSCRASRRARHFPRRSRILRVMRSTVGSPPRSPCAQSVLAEVKTVPPCV